MYLSIQQVFEEKIRSKKLLSFFQKKEKKYLLSQQNGVWMPIPQINAGKYIIKVKGIDMPFDDEFEEILEYEGFNINITINYGFQFEFVKVDEFVGYKNPREEQYNFNVASLKLKMQGEI